MSYIDRVYLSSDGSLVGAWELREIPADDQLPLAAGGGYTRTAIVRLPLEADLTDGTYQIIAVADDGNQQIETDETPQSNSASTFIQLAQPVSADLVLSSIVSTPELQPGQLAIVSWTVENTGLGIAKRAAGSANPWIDRVYLAPAEDVTAVTLLGQVQRTDQLDAGDSYGASLEFVTPNLVDGDYVFLVISDAENAVYEQGDEDKNSDYSEAFQLRHADLVPSILGPLPTVASGETITVNWSTANLGTAASLRGFTDRVYLSRDGSVDSSDVLLGERRNDDLMDAGASAVSGISAAIPADAVGDWFVLVDSDADGEIVEGEFENNNLARASLSVTLTPFADLVASPIAAPNLVIGDPALVAFSWSVSNSGLGAGLTDSWIDAVVISTNDVIGDGDDRVLERFPHSGLLPVGESYSRNEQIGLPGGLQGRFHLFVVADYENAVFENGLKENNIGRKDGVFDVSPIPYADLVVDSVEPISDGFSGQRFELAWTVSNQGIATTNSSNWNDEVYLVENADGSGSRIFLGDIDSQQAFRHIGFLQTGDSYARTGAVRLPEGIEGTYYFVVKTGSGGPNEFVFTGNNDAISGPVEIALTPPPDLIVSDIISPEAAPEGSAIDITWTVRNQGSTSANGTWTDQVLLRSFGKTRTQAVGSFNYSGPLEPGKEYTRTEHVRLPLHISDEYEVLVQTDHRDQVFEASFESNNLRLDDTTIQVAVLPRPDLQVAEIVGPATVDAGATASVEFVVINQGAVSTTTPTWSDAVYLSLDDKISRDDILVDQLSNIAALGSGEQYRSVSSTFEIPIRFRGTVYVIARADIGSSVDEWPNEQNNFQLHELFVNPWPFADLVASDVVAPVQAVEGSTFDVNYTVTNLGSGPTDTNHWQEQIWLTRDKNRPHPGQGDVLLTTIQHDGDALPVDAGYDRKLSVTLPDSLASGTYYITPWVDPYSRVLEDTLAININPDDPNEIDNNNYKARSINIIGRPPKPIVPADIEVESVTTDEVALAGETISVSWTVKNDSFGETRSPWQDLVYLSQTPSRHEPGSQPLLLGSFGNLSALPPTASYSNTQQFALPPSATGNYVIVESSFGDEDHTNNSKFAPTSVTRSHPDLVVTQVESIGTALSGETIRVQYTVQNQGSQLVWRGTERWTDQIWLSKDADFTAGSGGDFRLPSSRAVKLANVTRSNAIPLGPGASYTKEAEVRLPKGIGGDFHIFVFSNVLNSGDPSQDAKLWPQPPNRSLGHFQSHAYEDSTNNSFRIDQSVAYQEPDLKVTSLSAPTSVQAGSTIEATYTVTNVGGRDTREAAWYDRFFLSNDTSLDSQDYRLEELLSNGKVVSAESRRIGELAAGDSYTGVVRFTVPFEIEGDFHLIGYVDAGFGASGIDRSNRQSSSINPRLPGIAGSGLGDVLEFLDEGNNEVATRLQVLPLVAPDLQVIELGLPDRVVRGQAFDVTYTVANLGGDALPQQTSWDDLVYLSRDPFLDLKADRYLGTLTRQGSLDAGETYTNTATFNVPADLASEAYYGFVITDPVRTNEIGKAFEGANERNNERHADIPMIIELPPPTDLVVTNIEVPGDARSGEPIEVRWTVTNESDQQATGSWSDSIFLSTDGTWDIDDRPIGRAVYNGMLEPGESYTQSLTVQLPPSLPGTYRAIVRTDIFNQVYELEKDQNNTTASSDAVTVVVDELQLGIPEQFELAAGAEKLFQITVPINQTMRIRLNSEDKAATNEVFVRYDAAPTSASFDATYQGVISADPEVLVPSTKPGVYYILVRGFSGPTAGSPVQIKAELLPLVITDIRTDVGGDSAFVTTTIEGAQFRDGALVKLVRPGIAEFEPVDWLVVDSTKIIAKFDFTNAERGLYDLKVINPDGAEAIIPYRFLVERAIEPEVTIGIGGPRFVLAGDQATYSIALQNIANVDAPYTYFEYGAPELLINEYVYGLPYMEFSTNLRGTPEGVTGSANELVPFTQLDSITNTDGQLSAAGFLYDHPADGFGGLSFNVLTYPGLRELSERAFDAFRSRMQARLPAEIGQILDQGEEAVGEWWEAVKDYFDESLPGAGNVLDGLDFEGLFASNASVPGECERAFIPFRGHVYAAATTMTRDEFVEFNAQQARDLRAGILESNDAPGAILALAADEQTWQDLYLAALEDAGLLRTEDGVPPIREQQHIVSLMSTIASGILFGPAGSDIRSTGDLLGFFDQLRSLYGHDDLLLAAHTVEGRQCRSGAVGDVRVAIPPEFEDYDLGLSNPTHFESFIVHVPWVDFSTRAAGLPVDFQINGPQPVGGDAFQSLDFTELLAGQPSTQSLASITGPQTFDTAGWLPASERLPYAIRFENDEAAGRHVNEIQVISPIDEDLDGFSFELGDIRLGNIELDLPSGRSLYQGEFDFTESNGFILRVSAGIDLFQSEQPVANWLFQAIDPLTGELLTDATRGLLPPNDSLGTGEGFVSYSIAPEIGIDTGAVISADARILFDTAAPEDTSTIEQMVDGVAPTTTIQVDRVSTDANIFEVSWESTDDVIGGGFKHVSLFVAEDGGDFELWQRQLSEAEGQLVFEGTPNKAYEFLALSTDVAGNQEQPRFGQNVADDGSSVNLGGLPSVRSTTPPNFGEAPEPKSLISTNPLFNELATGLPSIITSTRPSEFNSVVTPLIGQAFVTGIPGSHADIGPMAIVEVPVSDTFAEYGVDGTFIVSGGENRGELYRVSSDGSAVRQPLAQLDHPIFNLAFDSEERLWATSGGGPLLQLDPLSGQIIREYGDGLTIALAVEPETDRIFVSSNSGVVVFDPATEAFEHFSRDLNLRVGSMAFDASGDLWATTWPDRTQVVRFTETKRAELMLEFDAPIDSLAFGYPGSTLADLMVVSANAGEFEDTGSVELGSALTLVDVATLRRTVIADGGTRGDTLITTTDGRILLSQTNQVDVLRTAASPSVRSTNPPARAAVALPLPFVSVTFDQDMLVADASQRGSVLNPENYVLIGKTTGEQVVPRISYDAENRTVVLIPANLLADEYTLTVKHAVESVFGQPMGRDFETTFRGIADLSTVVDFEFVQLVQVEQTARLAMKFRSQTRATYR